MTAPAGDPGLEAGAEPVPWPTASSAPDLAAAPEPVWVRELITRTQVARASHWLPFEPPPGHQRRSAVLVLFAGGAAGAGPDGVDVLLTERAQTLRSHAGQVAFPGGRIDPGDAGPGAAALREAREETGLDPAGVRVLAELADLYLSVSDYAVTPVLAWWHTPSPVGVRDPAEVARVVRVPVRDLTDPENRFRAVHPSGIAAPAFRVHDLFVWGFTAAVLDRLLHLMGWERAWDPDRLHRVPLVTDPIRDRSARA